LQKKKKKKKDLDVNSTRQQASHVTPSKQKQNIKTSAFIAVEHNINLV
jgi:hypothetical protein